MCARTETRDGRRAVSRWWRAPSAQSRGSELKADRAGKPIAMGAEAIATAAAPFCTCLRCGYKFIRRSERSRLGTKHVGGKRMWNLLGDMGIVYMLRRSELVLRVGGDTMPERLRVFPSCSEASE